MSDALRKDFSDKAQETVKPDSQKSVLDKATEGVTDTADKAAKHVQPQGDKSISQQASDTLSGTSKPGEKGIVEQASDAAGAALKYAQDTATDVYNKVADATTGEKK